jgi:NAD(P)-dependent dehydrogenase (short-subunit alcohol dehydrogenase family)
MLFMTAIARKVALVTGGAYRLGRAIAIGLAQAGWDIVIHYGTSQGDAEETVKSIEALGRQASALQCDLGDPVAVATLMTRANAVLGTISCLVNNASMFEFDDISTFSPSLLQRHMQINLSSPLLLAQALHAATPESQQSVVINLLDQKLTNINPDFLSYTLSKAGLECATTMLAQSLAPKVRVVGVSPGCTLPAKNQDDASFARAHAMTPLGRSSTADDIAAAVCFAVQCQAITGTTLLVDGGQHLLALPRDVTFLAK